MPAEFRLIACLRDNYAVLMHDPAEGATALIDAPDAGPIMAALSETGWGLTDILITHHHADHTQGVRELKQRYGCRVSAPTKEAQRIADVDITLGEGDRLRVGALSGQVIETPGHTNGHIAYWFASAGVVFVGDTLFSVGCGRILEGNAEMMWASLGKLRNLPPTTAIYCGHEYTAENVRFALTVEPDNPELKARADEVRRLREEARATIPTTLGMEMRTNPFLRADRPELAAKVGLPGAPPAQVFAKICAEKDAF